MKDLRELSEHDAAAVCAAIDHQYSAMDPDNIKDMMWEQTGGVNIHMSGGFTLRIFMDGTAYATTVTGKVIPINGYKVVLMLQNAGYIFKA